MKKFINIKQLQDAEASLATGGQIALYGILRICPRCGAPIYPGKPHICHVVLYGIEPLYGIPNDQVE